MENVAAAFRTMCWSSQIVRIRDPCAVLDGPDTLSGAVFHVVDHEGPKFRRNREGRTYPHIDAGSGFVMRHKQHGLEGFSAIVLVVVETLESGAQRVDRSLRSTRR